METLYALSEGDSTILERLYELPVEFRGAVKKSVQIAFAQKIFGLLRKDDTIRS